MPRGLGYHTSPAISPATHRTASEPDTDFVMSHGLGFHAGPLRATDLGGEGGGYESNVSVPDENVLACSAVPSACSWEDTMQKGASLQEHTEVEELTTIASHLSLQRSHTSSLPPLNDVADVDVNAPTLSCTPLFELSVQIGRAHV